MKMIAYHYFWCLMSMMLVFSGCGKRVITWGKKTFNQGEKIDAPVKAVGRHVKTLRLYDEFATRGIFDVLWLSDEVRRSYAQTYALKHGLSDVAYREFENEQRALNASHISFYVLAYQPLQPKIKIFTTEGDSWWSVYLQLGEVTYQPTSVSIVDIPAEYRVFFGERFNRYQTYYLVTCAVPQARELVHEGVPLRLNISAVQRKGVLEFNTPSRVNS